MTIESPAAALQPLADALGADGYEFGVEVLSPNAIRIDVRATENACEECLVPKELLADMAAHRLSEVSGEQWKIDVTYPADAHGA
jgi:hypothetical protein